MYEELTNIRLVGVGRTAGWIWKKPAVPWLWWLLTPVCVCWEGLGASDWQALELPVTRRLLATVSWGWGVCVWRKGSLHKKEKALWLLFLTLAFLDREICWGWWVPLSCQHVLTSSQTPRGTAFLNVTQDAKDWPKWVYNWMGKGVLLSLPCPNDKEVGFVFCFLVGQ